MQCLARLGPGDSFGEVAAYPGDIKDFYTAGASVVASTPVKVLTYTRQIIFDVMDASLRDALGWYALRISHRATEFSERMEENKKWVRHKRAIVLDQVKARTSESRKTGFGSTAPVGFGSTGIYP